MWLWLGWECVGCITAAATLFVALVVIKHSRLNPFQPKGRSWGLEIDVAISKRRSATHDAMQRLSILL